MSTDDHYHVAGNSGAEYMDAAQTVPKNKKGIVDETKLGAAEQEALVLAYNRILSELYPDSPLTCDLIRHIHARIFADLYEWAGRWRTVWISKPGVTWPSPDYLDGLMALFEQEVLCKYPPVYELLSDELFCQAAAEIQGEFLVIHPFREGNARTIKLATDVLASQTNRPPLRYDESDVGKRQYILAAAAAFDKNYAPMEAVIRTALDRAKNRPPENHATDSVLPS